MNTGEGRGSNPNSRKNLKKFKPGESGNPKGRPQGVKYISEALREQLAHKRVKVKTPADALAKNVMRRALGSDRALEIVLDRTEGKVTQPIGGEGGKPIEVSIDYKGKLIKAMSRHASRAGQSEGDSKP